MRASKLVTLIAALGMSLSAWAEENVMAAAFKSCKSDLASYCGNMKPGDGRLMGCLYAHDTKISTECGMALNRIAMEIENAKGRWDKIMSACEADFETFCPTVNTGDGRIVKCLTMQANTVEGASKGCVHVLENMGLH